MANLSYFKENGMELVICNQSTISYPFHNHISTYILGFVLNGTIELITDRGRNMYQENGIFAIFPYTPHCVNSHSCYTLLSLCIKAEYFSHIDSYCDTTVLSFLHNAINNPTIEEKIQKSLSNLAFIKHILPTQKETSIQILKRRLETCPEVKYSLDEMADATFMSKYNLIRIFKHEVGLTPHQFLLQNRIRKAQRLLETSATITEVALATGFCDQSHFIRHFKKIVGLTPTEYRLACNTTLPLFAN